MVVHLNQRTINQENIVLLNRYVPSYGALTFMKNVQIELKTDEDKSNKSMLLQQSAFSSE